MTETPSKVIKIRPKIIFGEIEKRFPKENVVFQSIMPPTMVGSMTLLEGAILASLVKLADARSIFEFGTYMGSTSVLFAMNAHTDAKIVTLDIDPAELKSINSASDDAEESVVVDDMLRTHRTNEGAPCILKAPMNIQKKITQLTQNSMTVNVDEQDLAQKYDMIFVDGGHDYETAACDSRNAFKMLQGDGVIAWHDYGSPLYSDVTRLVDELSQDIPIIHVEASMVAFHAPWLTDRLKLS